MIEARRVSMRAGKALLVRDVSLGVAPGEVVALIGPNGAGKSTLLRLLAGDAAPSSGEVLLAGRPLAAWAPRDLARVRAVLPQESTLAFAFTALDVVMMGRAPHTSGGERPEDFAAARRALAIVGLGGFEGRLYPTLSGGERQRVHLARVIAQIGSGGREERYLLLDEPTSSLDLAHQHGALRIARGMAREGAGVLVVLHDLNLAAQYADRIGVLSGGSLLAAGSPRQVLTREILREAFQIEARIVPAPWSPSCFWISVEA
jgi:iron complex transport system ATP-binding protein